MRVATIGRVLRPDTVLPQLDLATRTGGHYTSYEAQNSVSDLAANGFSQMHRCANGSYTSTCADFRKFAYVGRLARILTHGPWGAGATCVAICALYLDYHILQAQSRESLMRSQHVWRI